MKDEILSSSLTIRDPRAARLLVASETLALLEKIGADTVTAKEVADRLGIPVKLAWYRLRQLESCGLIRRDGSRARGGRPQPIYRMAALRFVVPAELRHATLGEALTAKLREALTRSDLTDGEEFFWADGRFRVEKLVDPSADKSPVVELWMRAPLDPGSVARLTSELQAVLARYRRPLGSREPTYLISVAAAPMPRD